MKAAKQKIFNSGWNMKNIINKRDFLPQLNELPYKYPFWISLDNIVQNRTVFGEYVLRIKDVTPILDTILVKHSKIRCSRPEKVGIDTSRCNYQNYS